MLAGLLVLTSLAAAGPTLAAREVMVLQVVHSGEGGAPLRDPTPKIAKLLSALTSLELKTPEQAGIDAQALRACHDPAKLACWAETTKAPYLLVVTILSVSKDVEHYAVLMLSTRQANAEIEIARARSNVSVEDVEDLIFEHAVISETGDLATEGDSAVEDFFDHFFEQSAYPMLMREGYWAPNGQLEVHAARPGLELSLDGVGVRALDQGTSIIDAVLEGEHVVQLRDPLGLISHRPLNVRIVRGSATRVSPAFEEGNNPAPFARTVTFWSGAIVAGTGASIVILALALDSPNLTFRPCPGDECSGGGGFIGTGDLGSSGPRAAGGHGLLLAPLGFALLGTGGTAALGARLIGDDWAMPWVAWLLSGAVGLATYAVSAAL